MPAYKYSRRRKSRSGKVRVKGYTRMVKGRRVRVKGYSRKR